ncbi:uncharacterized protein LOC127706777 [Mytilus californianus]|uniref:uncharacterized protein LOC127706777 n=1 Tax=Mytilus californianus TaxID=6549 RepID=UPI00224669A7|nr:uncharacterized protein LOC127706777 [Mytilus californianus]
MCQALFVFHIGIVFLCIVPHTRGEQTRVYSTNEEYEWFEAKNKCTLLTNERNFSTSTTRLGWTNFSAKYLPWVEYLGCFEFRDVERFYGLKKQVKKGEQLQECIVYCNGSQFFGLQESNCTCLHNNNRTDLYDYVKKPCDVATCSGDPFAFCAVGGRMILSVYQKVIIDTNPKYKKDNIGNCLEYKKSNGNFKANKCSTKLYPICFNDKENILKIGNKTESNWKDAFNNCPFQYLASYRTVVAKGSAFHRDATFWLSNTRRWQRIKEYTKRPYFCVAAKIKQNGVVETILRKCRDKLPGLCTGIRKASSGASSVTSSTLSQNTKHLSRRIHTSPFLQSSTLPGPTIAAFSRLPKSTIVSIVESTTSLALQETTLYGMQETLFPRLQKTLSPGFQETKSPGFLETTSSALLESSTAVPGSDGVIVIIAIIAAVILTIIVISVTVVFCKRKRTTQFTVSDQPMANVGKEVVYAQVNKPTVKREKSMSSQRSQPAASDDTYDHMDHCRLSQTHNPTESNYDTMRSIANAGEEENNYDHVTGTKMEPERFVVDGASNYSHVEVEFHEVKDI